MGEALDAAGDLVGISACYVAIGLLALTAAIAARFAALIDFTILGVSPFSGISGWINSYVVGGAQDAIKDLSRLAHGLESGLIDSLGLLIAIPALLYVGIRAAFEYLWNQALRPLIHSISDVAHNLAEKAVALAAQAETDITLAYGRATAYADALADRTLETARSYAEAQAASAIATAEGYADLAVGRLRAAEDGAIANVTGLVRTAEAEALAAAAAAETDAAKALASATAYADTIGREALRGIDDLGATVDKELAELTGALGLAGAAGLIASIPLLATLVQTIATETGLDNAACRSKVKGICGTDPSRWLGLLEGLAALGVGFSLADIVEHATQAIGDARGLLSDVGDLSADTITTVGEAIGRVAAGIAGA